MNDTPRTAVDGGTETRNAPATDTGPDTDVETTTESTTEPGPDSSEPIANRGLPLDETFEVLRNQRRRRVLRYLQEADGEVSLGELAEQIAAWENDKPVRQITSSERKRVYVGLYQCHLPKMDGMDVIDFNKPRGLIERGENAADVEPYLRRASKHQPAERSGFTVGLAVLGLTMVPVVVVAQATGVVPLVVALAVVVAATLAGVGALLRTGRDGDGDTPGDETPAE